jgi:hypothetical protein
MQSWIKETVIQTFGAPYIRGNIGGVAMAEYMRIDKVKGTTDRCHKVGIVPNAFVEVPREQDGLPLERRLVMS